MKLSCRGVKIDGDDESYDFGTGAGYYLNATEPKWSEHYRMYSYVVEELYKLVLANFNVDANRVGIFGHSMGGHGALVLALRHSELFHSVSAFAPVASPMRCPWGQKAFANYLGDTPALWSEHDASELMNKRQTPFPQGILIDQGLND